VQVNGTLDPEVLELRKQIEKQSSDLGNATRTLTELRSKVTDREAEQRPGQCHQNSHRAQIKGNR
jgi:hypothetical protein